MTRQEQDYYNDVSKQTTYLKRIADALDKMVNKEKDDRLNKFKKSANLLYGNDATVNLGKGRSLGLKLQTDDNYTYPQCNRPETFKPDIKSDLDERIYKESQSITGDEFSNWHGKLTDKERESYQRIYGH